MLSIDKIKTVRDVMDGIFKYKVGETLRHAGAETARIYGHNRTQGDKWEADAYDGRARYMVLERLLQECHGGVQLHYACRLVTETGVVDRQDIHFCEFELKPFDLGKVMEGYDKYRGDKK